MAPLYKPPTKVVTTQYPWLALVSAADPDFQRKKHHEVEYEFGGKTFFADPTVRGSFNDHSNVYPVGQPFGGNDPDVVNNKKPTVGNPSPGLYQGVATGPWA